MGDVYKRKTRAAIRSGGGGNRDTNPKNKAGRLASGRRSRRTAHHIRRGFGDDVPDPAALAVRA